MPPVIDKSKCIGCHNCATICPVDAYGFQKEKGQIPNIQYPRECKHCNACVLECPVRAISLRFPVPQLMVYYDVPQNTENKPEE